MKKCQFTLAVLFISITLAACAPSGPSTLEIMDSLETEINEQDLEGVMALFAEDAVVEESYAHITRSGTRELEIYWKRYLRRQFLVDFRDISVDGDTATYTWVEVGEVDSRYWPAIIEVQDGKITYTDILENKETRLNVEE